MTKSYKRSVINHRKTGDEVNPLNMTHKEFVNYLCHKFGFRIASGWDGIERRIGRPNYEEESSFDIQTRDEALVFLGISKTKESPDGLEKRQRTERRNKQQDIRSDKVERRTYYQRKKDRREEFLNSVTHIVTFVVCITFYLILWSIAS